MENAIAIKKIQPTVFLKNRHNTLQQLVIVTIAAKEIKESVSLMVKYASSLVEIPIGTVPAGESKCEIFIDEISATMVIEFIIKADGAAAARKQIEWTPPKHWTVHVVQASHHDVGYSDLPSDVLKVQSKWLDDAIDIAKETEDFPDDARFRIVIEQAWSLCCFIKNSPDKRVKRILDLLRTKRFEVAVLFGNMMVSLSGAVVWLGIL